jgi:type IV pilus assembly protein PilB
MRFVQKRRETKFLGRILIDSGIINEEDLDKALAVKKVKNAAIGDIFVEMGLASEVDILQAVIFQYRLPYIPLDRYDINPEVINLVSAKDALKYLFIPIEKIGSSLTIAMSNPFKNRVLSEIEQVCDCDVQVCLSTPTEILNSIGKYYNKEALFPLLPFDAS